jgi:hypothetical protein
MLRAQPKKPPLSLRAQNCGPVFLSRSESALRFPQFFHRFSTTANQTMINTNHATIASIAATIGLGLGLGLALSSQTRDLMAHCKQGPDPASCELRLLGR